MQSKLAQQALIQAQTQVGQKENPIGSNWGHPVQDYLALVGINFPASWCMAFVYWCYTHAASVLSTTNPMWRTGGVLAQLHNRESNVVKIETIADILPGDIFIMDFGSGLGHTGIVESVNMETGILNTIEGNTNDTGSREGIEVARKERKYPEPLIVAILRF